VKNESPSPTPRTNLGGRIWKIAMGALLMVVGSVFVSYLWGAYQRAALMDSWVETPCVILASSMDDSGRNQKGMPKYTLLVSYEYEFEGRKFEGDQFKRLPSEASDPRKVKAKLDDLEVGSQMICYVDPKSPDRAVLKRDTKAALYSIWFPCLFVIGGAGMILSALFRK
jgi:hypothetical protein